MIKNWWLSLQKKNLIMYSVGCPSRGENNMNCPLGCPSNGGKKNNHDSCPVQWPNWCESVIKCSLGCPSSGENMIKCPLRRGFSFFFYYTGDPLMSVLCIG